MRSQVRGLLGLAAAIVAVNAAATVKDTVTSTGGTTYNHDSCWTKGSSSTFDALSDDAFASNTMTVQKCADYCTDYKYFGVSNGKECYCGDSLAGSALPATSCAVACKGDTTELCGGPTSLNVYARQHALDIVPSSGEFQYQTCWTDGGSGNHALTDTGFSSSRMTVPKCAAFCDGYTYFGVSGGNKCYCGDTINSATQEAADQTDCNSPCAGAGTTACGGSARVGLYKIPIASLPSSSVPPTASSTTAPTATSTTATAATTDTTATTGTTGTSVVPSSITTAPTVSVTTSTTGTSTAPTSSALPDDDDCDEEDDDDEDDEDCDDDGDESSTVPTVTSTATPTSSSSVASSVAPSDTASSSATPSSSVAPSDTTSSSVTPTSSTSSSAASSSATDSSSTSATSSSAAASSSATDSATVTPSSSDAPTTTSTTSTPSSVAPTTTSTPSSVAPTTTSTTSTTSTSSTSSSTSTTVSPTASPKPFPDVLTYTWDGCYEEIPGRLFKAKSLAIDTLTLESCAAFCSSFPYFGVEYGRECYCGTDPVASGGVLASSISQCNMPCAGNSTEICGAGNRLSVYHDPAKSGPSTGGTGLSSTKKGCYTETNAGRTLAAKGFGDDHMTLQLCSTSCAGYKYWGVEYGRECFCDNTIQQLAQVVPDSQCNMLCSGDDSELCGAGNRIMIYERTVD